ncbi:MAG: XRE family transcriptional regulator [Caulobacteraceae bacterium]|nr:XRE family transcriptional regulator [Caulobacteraceae bacterium]
MSGGEHIEFEHSSGNIFEDIGFDKATAERLTHKADLVGVLYNYQRERDLSQVAFSSLVGIPQPRLSKLYNGKFAGMSTDKLLDAITRLGGRVTIRVESHPAPAEAGRVQLELV